MSKIGKRLDAHFVACAAAAGAAVVGVAQNAEAGIVHSGLVNIVIPDNIDGVYMNVVTGANAGFPPPAGYDINPYTAGAANSGLNLWGPTANTWFSTTGNAPAASGFVLPAGTPIGGAATNFFRPGGSGVISGVTLNSSDNLLGFRFAHEGNANAIHHGWIRLQFGATPGDRRIVEYAYEDVAEASINAGAVPAPGALALLALGAVGVAGRRRK